MEKGQKIDKKKYTYCWNCNNIVQKVIYNQLNEATICPKCGAKYPEKPAEESRLTILQDEYLSTKSKLAESKFFYRLNILTFNIICGRLKRTGKNLDPEKIEDMVQWSMMKLYSYYQKPNWKITGSFVGYISQVVLYPLYNKNTQRKDKSEKSLDAPLSTNQNNQNLLDVLSLDDLSEYETEMKNYNLEKDTVVNQVMEFIRKSLNKLYKSTKSLYKTIEMACLYEHYFNNKNDRFFTEVWRTCSIDTQDTFNKTLTILKKSLKEDFK